jgi:hypothetical protein
MSNPELIPLTEKQMATTPNNKMAKLLKNLIPGQISNKNSIKDSNLNLLLASMKRDNSPGRLSQRSSTSEIRKNVNKNALTPINNRSKNNGSNERSPSPKAPYLSIKDYLQGRNKKKDEENEMKTPAKNLKKSQKNLVENDTLKKQVTKNEDLKITIKEDIVENAKNENFQPKKMENPRKKPDFLVNVNINIENNMPREEEKNSKKVKDEMLKILKQKLPSETKIEDKEKRKNLIENFKIYDSKLAQLINSQKKPPTMVTTSLNVTQDKIFRNTTSPQNLQNNGNLNARSSNNFFEKSRNPTPLRGEDKKMSKEEVERKYLKKEEEERKNARKEDDTKSDNNKSILSSHSNNSKNNEIIIMKEQPNIVLYYYIFEIYKRNFIF